MQSAMEREVPCQMNLDFKKPLAEDAAVLAPYFSMRPNKTCDSGWLDTFIWADYYRIRYHIEDEKALLLCMQDGEEYFAAMPYCREEDLPHYFKLFQRYFNEVLKRPFKIYLADEEGVEYLKLKKKPGYIVKEEEDLKDYLYSGDDLRNLPGKQFQKKRNLVNKFDREYQGRWEYRTLHCEDRPQIAEFLKKWFELRMEEDADGEESLEYERRGIEEILQKCCQLQYRMGGIFIDGRIEAFSVGAYNALEKMACVSVEKGNAQIPGIYQVINQQYLIHEFPEAEIINREDDVGLEGLRRAKQSYNPIGYEHKYMVLQKNVEGYRDELIDFYEAEIQNYGSGTDTDEK